MGAGQQFHTYSHFACSNPIAGWLFLFAVLWSAILLFGMVFFVSVKDSQATTCSDLIEIDNHVLGSGERLY